MYVGRRVNPTFPQERIGSGAVEVWFIAYMQCHKWLLILLAYARLLDF